MRHLFQSTSTLLVSISVDARATNVGAVRVPVVLREGQTTIVYLDGTTAPVQNGEEASHWIWQPNGLIVGWKATGDEGVGDGSVHP